MNISKTNEFAEKIFLSIPDTLYSIILAFLLYIYGEMKNEILQFGLAYLFVFFFVKYIDKKIYLFKKHVLKVASNLPDSNCES